MCMQHGVLISNILLFFFYKHFFLISKRSSSKLEILGPNGEVSEAT